MFQPVSRNGANMYKKRDVCHGQKMESRVQVLLLMLIALNMDFPQTCRNKCIESAFLADNSDGKYKYLYTKNFAKDPTEWV